MNDRTPRGLLREIRRTRLLPVLAVYVSASVVIIQVVDIFVDRFGLPDWFFPGAMALLMLGLPIAIATALVQAGPRSEAGSGGRGGEEEQPASQQAPGAGAIGSPSKPWLTRRKATIAGAGALAGWGLIAAGFVLLRVLGIGPAGSLVAAGVIEMREPVLVAEFLNRTPDPYLADAVTEAFRVDLGRSDVVTQVEPDRVRFALERMNRPADAQLDAELAREVAIREGIKAIVTGDITAAGSGYVLSARLIATDGGEILRAARSEAANDGQVIEAIDHLSRQLRERIGESLRNIRRGESLERVTTASLEALHRYSRGIRALNIEGDNDRGIGLLEEAVALDSTFAMAYRRLGIALRNRGDGEAGDSALARAYRHRERLTEEERYLAAAAYFSYPGDDKQRATRAYEALLELNPHHGVALNNLALLYAADDEPEQAVTLLRRAVEQNPRNSRTPYTNLFAHLMRAGEVDDAASLIARMRENFPPRLADRLFTGQVAFARADFAGAAQEWRAVADSAGRDADVRRGALFNLASSAAVRGRLAEAERLLQEQTEAGENPARDGPGNRMNFAWMRLLVGQADEALRLADAALADHQLGPDDNDLAFLGALLYAAAGRPDDARGIIARYNAVSETPLDQMDGSQAKWADAVIAVADGRPDDGIPTLREMAESCRNCGLLLSQAFDGIGEPDSAAAHARQFFEPALDAQNSVLLAAWLGEAIWRVAEAEEAAGAAARAATYYARFAELWAGADADLQPRVTEARRRIQALGEAGSASESS